MAERQEKSKNGTMHLRFSLTWMIAFLVMGDASLCAPCPIRWLVIAWAATAIATVRWRWRFMLARHGRRWMAVMRRLQGRMMIVHIAVALAIGDDAAIAAAGRMLILQIVIAVCCGSSWVRSEPSSKPAMIDWSRISEKQELKKEFGGADSYVKSRAASVEKRNIGFMLIKCLLNAMQFIEINETKPKETKLSLVFVSIVIHDGCSRPHSWSFTTFWQLQNESIFNWNKFCNYIGATNW